MLHKVPNELGSSHPNVEESRDALFSSYLVTNFSDRQQEEVTVFEAKQWNYDKAGPTKLERKTL